MVPKGLQKKPHKNKKSNIEIAHHPNDGADDPEWIYVFSIFKIQNENQNLEKIVMDNLQSKAWEFWPRLPRWLITYWRLDEMNLLIHSTNTRGPTLC